MEPTESLFARRLTRRFALRALALGGGAALLAACQQPAPAAAPTAVPKAAAPTAAPAAPAAAAAATAKPAAAAPAAPAAAAQANNPLKTPTDWQAQWDKLVADAKREGKVIVSSAPAPELRTALPEAFQKEFGIEMEYLGSSTGQMMSRLDTERAAGTYTVDCICGGATSMYTVAHPKGWLEDLTQVIFHPEATDATKWISARPWFMDPEQKQIVRLSTQLTLHVGVNSELVNHNELKKWSDLLDPKYKGKISVYDPTVSGTGWNTANYLLRQLGDDFVKKLYVDQDPGISREDRQLADWMARGQYPITLGLNSTELEPLRADGFKIELVLEDTPEAPGITTAGWGLGVLLKNAPHPNASKLFMNWIVMRGGQRAFNEPLEYMSVRSDVDSAWAPDYVKAKPGRQYLDTYDWDFVQATRNPTELERLKRLVTKA